MLSWRHWRTSEDFRLYLFLGVLINQIVANGIAYVFNRYVPLAQ
nr:MAG TPA: hypothetical protein [Caudoviricetes sp.]